MLLAVDVGNTQTVLGLFEGERLADSFRLATDRSRTGDELGVTLGSLFELEEVDGICLSTTVPALQREWERVAERWAEAPLLTVGPGVKTGIPIRYDDPREVGPDRIVNAVAASERYGAPCIVVDFGTSTNFDIVSPDGEYVGGVLAPGIEISMDALFARAARLVKVDFSAPATVIGKTTVGGLQSGLVYGFAGQVDGIVGRIRDELGVEAQTVATGGLADLIAPHARTLDRIDPHLTLEGLRIVWSRNAVGASRRRRSRSAGRAGPRRPRAAPPPAPRSAGARPARRRSGSRSTSSVESSTTSSCLNGRGKRPRPRYQP